MIIATNQHVFSTTKTNAGVNCKAVTLFISSTRKHRAKAITAKPNQHPTIVDLSVCDHFDRLSTGVCALIYGPQ